jgi:putative transposase
MAAKREKPEDIVFKRRQVEVLQGQGKSVPEKPLAVLRRT